MELVVELLLVVLEVYLDYSIVFVVEVIAVMMKTMLPNEVMPAKDIEKEKYFR